MIDGIRLNRIPSIYIPTRIANGTVQVSRWPSDSRWYIWLLKITRTSIKQTYLINLYDINYMTAKKCFPTSCFEQERAKLIEKRNLMQGELGQTGVAGYCATCCRAYYSAIVLVNPSSSSWDFLSSLSSMLSPPRLFQIHTHHTGNYNATGICPVSSCLQQR